MDLFADVSSDITGSDPADTSDGVADSETTHTADTLAPAEAKAADVEAEAPTDVHDTILEEPVAPDKNTESGRHGSKRALKVGGTILGLIGIGAAAAIWLGHRASDSEGTTAKPTATVSQSAEATPSASDSYPTISLEDSANIESVEDIPLYAQLNTNAKVAIDSVKSDNYQYINSIPSVNRDMFAEFMLESETPYGLSQIEKNHSEYNTPVAASADNTPQQIVDQWTANSSILMWTLTRNGSSSINYPKRNEALNMLPALFDTGAADFDKSGLYTEDYDAINAATTITRDNDGYARMTAMDFEKTPDGKGWIINVEGNYSNGYGTAQFVFVPKEIPPLFNGDKPAFRWVIQHVYGVGTPGYTDISGS